MIIIKKFSLLSGVFVNAGDFLIVDRTRKLLEKMYPNCVITEYKRNKKLDEYLDEINKTDALIIAGGSAYMINIYPDIIPLVNNLDDIKTKIFAIGLGWYGKSTDERYVNNYKFTTKTKQLIERIAKDSGVLSCKDWYTVKVLEKNGFTNAILTGCPAWYNLEKRELCNVRQNLNYDYKKICVSDPGDEVNLNESLLLTKMLKIKYPSADIHFVFHRLNSKNKKINGIIKRLEEEGIAIDDISGGKEGMKIYDDCDFHIGYRVHAHI